MKDVEQQWKEALKQRELNKDGPLLFEENTALTEEQKQELLKAVSAAKVSTPACLRDLLSGVSFPVTIVKKGVEFKIGAVTGCYAVAEDLWTGLTSYVNLGEFGWSLKVRMSSDEEIRQKIIQEILDSLPCEGMADLFLDQLSLGYSKEFKDGFMKCLGLCRKIVCSVSSK